MTTTPCGKRISVDVSDLVDQIRPYTPQANRKAFREAPLNFFDANTPMQQVFSSPLPPTNSRGKLTAEEAAKEVLDNDPFLNFHAAPEHPDDRSQSQIVNIKASRSPNENVDQQDRVSASFHVHAPRAVLAFSPVLPPRISETRLATEPLPSAIPTSPSYTQTRSHDDVPTPVSAAKPPRPPRLQPLHSPSKKPSPAYPSPAPSTPFGSTIPLSYSAVKTPGAAPLDYLRETPASAKQNSDPASMVEFFRSRSAHVTSPIFSTKKKLDCEDLGSPEVNVNPLAENTDDSRAVPDGVLPEVVVRMDFSLGYGFDRAEDVDLSSRANRVPVLYAVVVRTTDLDGDICPVFARLERDSDSAHTMLVDVIKDTVQFVPVETSSDSGDEGHDGSILEAVLTFWAAPDSFIQFGSAALLLTVTDKNGMSHETKVELHVVGTEPVIAVGARENHPKPERKETTVTFEYSLNPAEESITIWNHTFGGAPLLLSALVADSASGAFTVRDRDGKVRDCIPMMIPGGKSYTFTACFELLPDVTLRGRYYGCVLLKLATLMPARGRHTSSDMDLHQFYDHVLNFEAHLAGVAPTDRLSTLEDPSSNNIEEMLYEHRYGNDDDIDLSQAHDHTVHHHSQNIDERLQEDRDTNALDGALKRLSLVVPSEARESLPDDFGKKPYMVCEYNLNHPPRWLAADGEFVEESHDHEQLESNGAEMHDVNNHSEEESKRFRSDSSEVQDKAESRQSLHYSQESYEEWKKSLEDTDSAIGADVEDKKDVVRPDQNASVIEEACNEDERVSKTDGNIESNLSITAGLALNHEIAKQDIPQNNDSSSGGAEACASEDQVGDIVEPESLKSTQHRNAGRPQVACEEEVKPVQKHPSISLDASNEVPDQTNSSAPYSSTNPRVSATAVADIKSSLQVNTTDQGALHVEKKYPDRVENQSKPPLPTKAAGIVGSGPQVMLPQDGAVTVPDRFAPIESRYLVDDPVEGVHRKTRKGIIETVGAVVDGLWTEQGFLKQYTKFDSAFNMSEDLSARGSRQVSLSSVGSLATVNGQQRPGIRNLASKWSVKKKGDIPYRPKLRLPRKFLQKGLSIATDSGSTKLTVCNGSLAAIRVDISTKQGLKLRSQILIQPQFLALRPEQKAAIRLTRLTSEESKVNIVLACSNLNGPETLSCTYRLPVVIEAAKNRVPLVQGFAVDRPTLTFYNPRNTARHCRVRVLNGTRRKAAYKVWIGKNKDRSSYYESAFSILSHHEGTVEPQKCFSIIVVFDALGQTEFFRERLFISVGRKTDFIPMFGYGGASNIKFSRSAEGHLRAHNSGCRYGFLILSGPEVESPENAVIKAVLAPEETRDFIPPYGSGTIIYTGDEIARTRLCRSQEIVETESGEKSDESGLFLGHFERQEQAEMEEGLFWDQENKHTLHYAGRLLDSNTRRFMFDTYSENIVPYDDRHREVDLSWHASVDESRFVHIENYDSKHELTFTAVGAEPNAGSIPPLGDAIVAAFAETVQIFARGQCRELESQSME